MVLAIAPHPSIRSCPFWRGDIAETSQDPAREKKRGFRCQGHRGTEASIEVIHRDRGVDDARLDPVVRRAGV